MNENGMTWDEVNSVLKFIQELQELHTKPFACDWKENGYKEKCKTECDWCEHWNNYKL